MGNKTGIKWDAVSEVQAQSTVETIGSNVQIILRDPKTKQEWVTSSVDYINALVALGVITSSGGYWDTLNNNIFNNNSGNVGIGLDNPLSKLHVVGGILSTENANQLNGINFGAVSGGGQLLYMGTSADDYNGFQVSDDDNTVTGRDLVTGTLLRLLANDGSGNFEERVTFLNNGNVGIGTATPTSLLTVEDGDIEITNKNNGLIVYSQDGTAWRVGVNDLGVVTATAV
jgi:hypothetical protein